MARPWESRKSRNSAAVRDPALNRLHGDVARLSTLPVALDRLELAEEVACAQHREHDLVAVGSTDEHLDPAREEDQDGFAAVALQQDGRAPPITAGVAEAKQRGTVLGLQHGEEAARPRAGPQPFHRSKGNGRVRQMTHIERGVCPGTVSPPVACSPARATGAVTKGDP